MRVAGRYCVVILALTFVLTLASGRPEPFLGALVACPLILGVLWLAGE